MSAVPFRPASVLITGISSFVGLRLIPALLESGIRVHGLGGTCSPALREWVDRGDLHFTESRMGDVAGLRALLERNGIDAIAHLASRRTAPSYAELMDNNVMATARLLEAIQLTGAPIRYIQLSSSAVYGEPASREPIGEESPIAPITPYGASKAAADVMALERFREAGLRVTILRPFNLIGRGQSPAFFCPKVMKQLSEIQRGETQAFSLGDLSSYRDFLDVSDFIRALLLTLEKGESGATYNVCSGRATQLTEVAAFAMKKLGREAPVHVNHQAATLKNNVNFQVGSYEKLRARTGWRPETSLEASLEEILAEFSTQP